MKNFYNITKSQLIVLWFFGLVGWFFSMAESSYSDLASALIVIIPAFIIFYTLGWRNYNLKNKKESNISEDKIINKTNFKKIFKIISIALLILSAIGVAINFILLDLEKKRIREEYIGNFNRLKNEVDRANVCLDFAVEKGLSREKAECESTYNEAYNTYQECKDVFGSISYKECSGWSGRNSNYEEISCSEEKISLDIRNNFLVTCSSGLSQKFESVFRYERDIVSNFLRSQPLSKSSFSISEMQNLYALFPQEVLNEKTKERIDKEIKSRGYSIEN